MFIRLFKEIDPEITFQIYDIRNNDYPKDLNECNAYITTGSRASTYDDLDWIPPLKQLFKDLYQAKVKLVGICFGHQLIADTFGGNTTKSDKGWGVGVSQNQVLKTQHWMKPELAQVNVIVSHQDQVTQLPDNAELLMESDFCPNYMYQIGNEILTIQGHPEFSKEYAETLMRHRESSIGNAAFHHGLSSLSLQVHDKELMQWIVQFMLEDSH